MRRSTLLPQDATGRRAVATTAGLALVPALVAGALAWGLYDPVDRLDRIDAAVVNLDEPVTVDGELVPLGRQVVAALTAGVGLDGEPLRVEGAGADLDWTLTDATRAADGLADGSYAAVVTIPEDFSAAATSLSAEDPTDATTATLQVGTTDDGPVADSAVAAAVGTVVADTLGQELTTSVVDNLYIGFAGISESLTEAAGGAGELGEGTSELAEGLALTDDGAGQVAGGLAQLSAGTAELAAGLSATDDGAEEVATGLARLSAGSAGLAAGTDELAAGAGAGADGASQLADGLRALEAGTSGLPADTRALADGAAGVADGTGELATRLGELATGLQSAATGTGALPGATAGLSDGAAGVDAGAQELTTGTTAVSQAADQALAACRQQPDADCAALAELSATAGEVAAGALELAAGATALADGADELAASVPPPTALQEAADGSAAAAAGAATLAGGAQQVADGASALADGTPALAQGVAGAAAGAASLADGSAQLAAGVRELAAGADQLAAGTSAAADGSSQLAGGVGQLASGADELAGGAGAAADGAEDLAEGTGRLADGSTQLADGVDELAAGLAEGAAQVPVYDEGERRLLSDVAARPVTAAAAVGTTGERGMAYLAALALGIGALATFLVVRPVPARALSSRTGSLRLALRSFAPAALVTAVQAAAVALVVALTLDLSPWRAIVVAVVLLVVGLALVATNQALVAWLGHAGRLVSLAVLSVSVPAALVGTAPEVLRTLVAWTPMAAATDALRSTVLAQGAAAAVLGLLLWTLAGLAASALAVRRVRSVPSARLAALAG